MSFSSQFAGKQADLVTALDQDPHQQFAYGGELGKLTQDYLKAVAQLCNTEASVYVEANGHNDPRVLSLNVRVTTVYHPMPAASHHADYVSEHPDAATHHPDHHGDKDAEGTLAGGHIVDDPNTTTSGDSTATGTYAQQ